MRDGGNRKLAQLRQDKNLQSGRAWKKDLQLAATGKQQVLRCAQDDKV